MFDVALTKGRFFLFYMFMFDYCLETAWVRRSKALVNLMSHFFVVLVKNMKSDLQLKLHMHSDRYNGG